MAFWFILVVMRLQQVACQVEGMTCSALGEHNCIALGEQFRIQIILSSSCEDDSQIEIGNLQICNDFIKVHDHLFLLIY